MGSGPWCCSPEPTLLSLHRRGGLDVLTLGRAGEGSKVLDNKLRTEVQRHPFCAGVFRGQFRLLWGLSAPLFL